MRYASLLALSITLILLGDSVFGQANEIDQTFRAVPSQTPGPGVQPGGQLVQADGKIIVWGNALTFDGVAKGQIARLNENGTLDPSFDYCACGTGSSPTSVILRSDGKLLVAGNGENGGAKVVLVNQDGTLDNTFATSFPPGTPTRGGTATVLAAGQDNRLLVQTHYSEMGYSSRAIYRLNADGSQDPSFTIIDLGTGSHFGTYVTAAQIQTDGRIVFALYGYDGGGGISGYVRRYNIDGTTDTNWQEPVFGPSRFNVLRGLAIQPDGKIVVGGVFNSVNGLARNCYVRLNPAGNVDLTFVPSGFFEGELNTGQVGILQSGKILVTGKVFPNTVPKLFRLNSDGSRDNSFTFDPTIGSVDVPWVLDASERIIFFGTTQTNSRRFFRLTPDGTAETTFNPNSASPGRIHSSVTQADGHIVIVGDFFQVNGVSRHSIARLNSDGSIDTTFDPGAGFPRLLDPVSLALQPDGRILAVGSFTSYNGIPRAGFARINSDGSLDTAYDPTFSSAPWSIALQPDGKVVAVGGFSSVNGTSRPLIARLNQDGSLDQTLAPMIGGSFLASVALYPDGRIMIGGNFSGINGFNRSNLARLNSDGTLDESFNAGTVLGPENIWLQADGKALLGYSNSVVRRNINGTPDSGFAAPVFSGNNPAIHSALIQSDGSIVVGGAFARVAGITRNNIVRLSPTGSVDQYFFPSGANNAVGSLIAYADNKILVGGSFDRFENEIRAGIVRINTAPYHANTPFDFDGDGRADISVTRPGTSYVWYQLLGSSYIFSQTTFGQTGDVVTPADFDGDGTTDIAIFRAGDWWWRSSINGQQQSAHWGTAGDIPLPGDIDGDGKADFVVYRNGIWYRVINGSTTTMNVNFGTTGDKALLADFDGDGKADPAIFRPSTGTFWYAASSAGGAHRATQWGISTDVPVPADYDGDGKTDFAVYRPAEGAWYVLNSSNGQFLGLQFGLAEDRPIPADYDGDGKADIAVYRPSTGIWYLLQSTAGFQGFQWGISTDIPSPAAYIPQ